MKSHLCRNRPGPASLPLSASPFPNDVNINRKPERLSAAWRLQQKVDPSHHKEVWAGFPVRLKGVVGAGELGSLDGKDQGSPRVQVGRQVCSGDLGWVGLGLLGKT